MKQVLLALALTLNVSIAIAGFTDGNELYKYMLELENPNGSELGYGLFMGYVGGVVDVGDGVLFCTTSGVTRGQFIAIVAKYLKNNPEKWNMSADSIVFYAMKEAFPCKK